MEESISGFKIRGTWDDVVEHGERITRALRDAMEVDGGADDGTESDAAESDYDDAFEEWDAWRPKVHERTTDVNEKTAAQASVEEGEGEKAGKNPDDDLQTAGERLTESYERLEQEDTEGAVEKWHDSIDYVTRAADSAGRKALRKVEDTVYRKVMTQVAPYYFDNELVSANLQRSAQDQGEERFIFEVNVNDDDLKADVSDRLSEYEDDVDRWHIDTQKETETAEAAEGVEPPEEQAESKPTSN